MRDIDKAAELFGLVCEGVDIKIVDNNVKNARILVKELADVIKKAKESKNKSDVERFLEEAVKKAALLNTSLSAALDYSKEHSNGF